jgi:S1-C subfamily serine protease
MKTKQMIVAACLLGMALPVSADGILEQMENEVSAIARRTKSAVVTIEDSRALLVAYDTSPLEKADLSNRIAHLAIDKKAADDDLARVEVKFRAGQADALAVVDARSRAERIAKQLSAEQRNLDQFGRATPLQRQRQDVADALALLAIDKQAAESRVAIEEQRYKAGVVTSAELETPKTELAHLQQEITAQTARGAMLDQLMQRADANRHTGGDQVDNPTGAQRAYKEAVYWYERADANSNPPRSGTGFSIGEGFIVTTADVLDGMSNPVVITDGGEKIRASVIAIDTELNVGMVKLAAQADIPALILGDSTKVMPGCFAISIGNQHGNANAVALNLVAGIRTEATYSGDHFYPSLIQFSGTVGAGTSGAPLVNSHGEVIGIVAGVPQAEPEPGQYLYFNTGRPMVQQPPVNFGFQPQYGAPSSGQAISNWYQNSVPSGANGAQATPIRANIAPPRSASRLPIPTKAANKQTPPPVRRGRKPASDKQQTTVRHVRMGRETDHKPAQLTKPTPALGLSWVLASSRNAVNYPYQTYNLVATTSNSQPMDLGYAASPNSLNLPELPVRPAPVVTSAGFAIPIGEVQAVLLDMKAGRPIVHGWIGVDLENEEHGTEQNGIVKVLRTVKVKGVYAGSPANRVGVMPGDILISLDDKALHTISDVRTDIMKSTINKPVNLAIDRNGQLKTWQVVVEPRPTQTGKVITASNVSATPVKGGGK